VKTLAFLNPKKRRKKSKAGKTSSKPASRPARKKARRRIRRSAIPRTLVRAARRYRRRRVRTKVTRSKTGRSATIRVRVNPRRRRRTRSNPFIPGGIQSTIKGLFSKENVTIAVGGVAATFVTRYALSMKKADGTPLLPRGTGELAKAATVAYAVAIPVAGALLTRRFSPAASKGMLFGGLINGIVAALQVYAPDVYNRVSGAGEYLDYVPTSSVGALPPGYMGARAFQSVSPLNGALDNQSAFGASAWGE
jgi:hypothetical protein